MNADELLIRKFYSAFQKRDASAMNACYADDIVFFDPMFDLLRGDEARAMWEMLCKHARDFSLEFSTITDLGEQYYTCEWIASYTFSKTGRKVINKCKAHMKIENGQIIEHSDAWSLAKWSAQAIGVPGKLFGWLGLFRRRIKNDARRSLLKFMGSDS